MKLKLINIKDYLLLIEPEAKVKRGDLVLCWGNLLREYTDEYATFPNKIIAYYPLSRETKELDLPWLPNPFKKGIDIDNLVEYESKVFDISSFTSVDIVRELQIKTHAFKYGFKKGYKAAQSDKQFSLEDIIKISQIAYNMGENSYKYYHGENNFIKSINEDIQSLSTQQLPKEFIPEYESKTEYGPFVFKIIINLEGKKEIQGTYKY